IENFTVFIPEALVDELVEVKIIKVNKSFAVGKLMRIIEASKDRVEPACPVAKRCGGCSLQHLKYEAQLQFKTNKVKAAMERIGGFSDVTVLDTIGMENPYNYRNKAQFPVGMSKDGVAIGFYAKHSHNIVECDSCKIQNQVNDQIVKIVKDFVSTNKISVYNEEKGSGIIRHVVTRVGFVTGEVMVCIVVNNNTLPKANALIDELIKIPNMTSIVLNVNKKDTNVILGDKTRTLWGKDFITDYIGDVKFEISPISLYQVNPVQTKILYEKAVEIGNLTGNENVLDIYCGIGTISLFMAQKAKKVMGVEIIPEAVADAKKNAEINGIKNVEFKLGSAENIIPMLHEEGFKPDVVVVDPPRKGCDKIVLDTIVKMMPEKVVYVSCDPATMARDMAYLTQNNYTIGNIQPVDQFCQSTHVETIIMMTYCGDKPKK
ncbi:MAG: 23S rRNA (uracil(1939)-C(5))-methyltransferase RlmD, partial [Anaerotignaceae bacterium]